jgi:endonuclease/exonuclease/phosphatase family metal-dependent hydrolase
MPSFSLLTLNSFGLPFFLGWRRMGVLAGELNQRADTVICLQEIQQDVYIPILKKHLTHFPNQCYKEYLFAPMGGLVTASKLPFVSYEFLPFPNRGRWWSIGFADWALRKGVLASTFEVDGQQIIVLNTHIHANYLGSWSKDSMLAKIQSDQVRFLAEQAKAQSRDALVIICGDFNFHRDTFLYEELAEISGFTDPLKDDPRPTYRPVSMLASKWSVALDFIFYRNPDKIDMSIEADILPIENSRASSSSSKFLSDHCALTIKAHWRR